MREWLRWFVPNRATNLTQNESQPEYGWLFLVMFACTRLYDKDDKNHEGATIGYF